MHYKVDYQQSQGIIFKFHDEIEILFPVNPTKVFKPKNQTHQELPAMMTYSKHFPSNKPKAEFTS
jgi:hypothetical protein